MDIQVSSNFERLLFDLSGRDAPALAGMMKSFDATKALSIPHDMVAAMKPLFSSARIDADAMSMAMRWAWDRADMLLDPHTAIGLAAAREADLASTIPVITLATAHPAKFRDPVERATGMRPTLPMRLGSLMDREERFDTLPGTKEAVAAYVTARAVAKAG